MQHDEHGAALAQDAASRLAEAEASGKTFELVVVLRGTVHRRPGPGVLYFEQWSTEHPGTWPGVVAHPDAAGKPVKAIEPVTTEGAEIQATLFDMWRQDHPDVSLEDVPGDFVTTSGSGLDPDITLANARFQLERVASAWATALHRDPKQVQTGVNTLLNEQARAPWGGLIGESMVNVLELNLELQKRYGAPPAADSR